MLPLLVSFALNACHTDARGTGARDDQRSHRAVSAGEWTLMHFLGGPPAQGQITDTIRLDPAATGRRVRIERNRAGVAQDRTCEVVASDDAVWAELSAALADADLEAALAHPDRMPGLLIDVGYFSCTHRDARIAVSDHRGADSKAPREIVALRRLASAYDHLVAEVTAQSGCELR
jgi:hypothetical protein